MDFKGPENKKKRGDFQRSVSTRDEREKPVSSKIAIVVTGTALDNFVILKEIFGYLSPGDLRSCCKVNQTWRSIADSMIFDYQMKWKDLSEIEVRITKGFMDPQIETRTSTIAAESEYLQHLKRAPFVYMEFSIGTCDSYVKLIEDCREFLKRVGSNVYKLYYMGTKCPRLFFSSKVYKNYGMNNVTIFHCRHFPNLEDLRLLTPDNYQLFWPAYNSWDNFQLLHVRKFYTGQGALIVTNSKNVMVSKILEFMPNVREMYGMPCTVVREFQLRQKLHILRSVGFYRHDRGWTEDEAMKSLLNSSLKFQFLVIGRNKQSDCGLNIKRNKQNLETLLEIGKESLTHLMLRALKPELIIDLPNEMPAVHHITFRGRGVMKGSLYFKAGEDLSKRFPNLKTITFMDFRTREWLLAERWWKWMDSCSCGRIIELH